jgi:Big-like domain-containing protein
VKNVVRWQKAGRGYGILRGKEKAPRLARPWGSLSRSLVLLGAVCLVAGFASAQSVTILQPAANSTVASPVRVQATVQDSSTVKLTQIFVDGLKAYEIAASGVNTTLPMTSGNHRIAVQAVDSAARVFKSVVYVNVSGGSPAPVISDAATATASIIYDRVEEKTGWQTCGNCGNTGATGATATYHMTRGIGSPSEDGSSAMFSISGPAFKNGYWWISDNPVPNQGLKYLRYEFDIYIPKGYENAPQAIEFECQQRLNGWVYNFAWQAEYPNSVWRVFNYTMRRWESTGIHFNHFTPGTWHHIVTEFHNDPSTHRVYHDAITVDGVRHAVTQAAVHSAKNTGGANYFNNAFQLDLNSKGTPYKVYVDRMKVTIR